MQEETRDDLGNGDWEDPIAHTKRERAKNKKRMMTEIGLVAATWMNEEDKREKRRRERWRSHNLYIILMLLII